MPISKGETPLKIAFGPSHIGDDVIARVIEHHDCSGHIESWNARTRSWEKGDASWDDFILGRPVSPNRARRLRIPHSELS